MGKLLQFRPRELPPSPEEVQAALKVLSEILIAAQQLTEDGTQPDEVREPKEPEDNYEN